MLNRTSLKDLVHKPGLTQTDKLLLCLAVETTAPKTIAQLRAIARSVGLNAAKWNVGARLGDSSGRAINSGRAWELTASGKEHVQTLAGGPLKVPSDVAYVLRDHLSKLSDPNIAKFAEEAIRCFETGLYRSSVVLSWVGAVSLLYDHVIKHELATFNSEAHKRNNKWKDAKNADDLPMMKERDFLDLLQAISVIGKSVKEELIKRLELRNGCGHPNSLSVGEHTVAAHIETLILNVFSRFPV